MICIASSLAVRQLASMSRARGQRPTRDGEEEPGQAVRLGVSLPRAGRGNKPTTGPVVVTAGAGAAGHLALVLVVAALQDARPPRARRPASARERTTSHGPTVIAHQLVFVRSNPAARGPSDGSSNPQGWTVNEIPSAPCGRGTSQPPLRRRGHRRWPLPPPIAGHWIAPRV